MVLVIGLFCACGGTSSPKTLQDLLHQAGLTFQSSEHFRIAEQFVRQRQGASVLSAKTRNGDTVVKIELITNIDPDAAQAFIDERKYAILSLYQSFGSAYPGTITNTVSIPEAFKPEVVDIHIDNIETPVYLLWSNSRFNYGVAIEDLAHYRAALVFFYHPEQRVLIRLDLFMPKAQFERQKVLDWLGTLAFSEAALTDSETSSSLGPGETSEPSPVPAEPTQAVTSPHLSGYNLIVVGFEPLGANHVSAYGYAKHTTPHLDRFAQDAYLFEQAISPSSWTLPVFMSWFTGMYPSQHGIVNKYRIAKSGQDILSNLNDLTPSVLTLAQVLKRHGYQTAGFTGGAALSQDFGFAKGFDTYDGGASFGGFDRSLPLALNWLQENGTRKFFLFVQGFDVHGRFPLPEGADNPFLADNDAARFDGAPDAYWQLRNLSIENEPLNLSEEQRQFWINTYDAKIFEADKRFGEFIDALAVMRLLEKTIVIISSGSGNEYGEHQRFDHGFSLYDELIRVPLIIRIPETRGGVIKAQVRTLDIMPTIMDLLALPTDETLKRQMQGISLWPLITGVPMQLDAFAETDYLLQAFKRCLRTADGWKYIYSLDSEARELYHLSQDPGEKSNLIGKQPRMAYTLEQRLFKHLNALKSDSAP
jgi:choline-sulfatase